MDMTDMTIPNGKLTHVVFCTSFFHVEAIARAPFAANFGTV